MVVGTIPFVVWWVIDFCHGIRLFCGMATGGARGNDQAVAGEWPGFLSCDHGDCASGETGVPLRAEGVRTSFAHLRCERIVRGHGLEHRYRRERGDMIGLWNEGAHQVGVLGRCLDKV